jgi:hypothetical protein
VATACVPGADPQVIRPAKLWCDVESKGEAEELSGLYGQTIVPSFTGGGRLVGTEQAPGSRGLPLPPPQRASPRLSGRPPRGSLAEQSARPGDRAGIHAARRAGFGDQIQ